MTPTYIFDLDGTLALCHHRQHILDNRANPHRWRDFFKACVDDEPNRSVIHTFHALLRSEGAVAIWSGRSDEVREETEQWLESRLHVSRQWLRENLRMRPAGDSQPDDTLKGGWMDSIITHEYAGPVAIFDDRQKVVDMWRSRGLTCYQVQPSFD